MFRQIAAISLIFLFAAFHFNRAIMVLDYAANQASFAKNCENKAKPAMHCNGKCQLMKKLKEEEKKEEQNPSRKSENKIDLVDLKPPAAATAVSVADLAKAATPFSDTSFPNGVSPDIFHPPALA